MYTVNLPPASQPMPFAAPLRAASVSIALLGSTLAVGGTGSVFDIARVNEWRGMVQHRVPYVVDTDRTNDGQEYLSDIRSAAEHLANIRQVLSPAVADLATVFGVSRQAIYKWIGGETTPEPDKFERIRALSHAADAFRQASLARAPALLKMKAFDGLSLMDLAANGQLATSHVQALITEAQAMESGYKRSGLARTKARPSEDWLAELSIPGSSE